MGSVSGQAGRTDGPISRTASYRPNRPAASDPYRAALRQRSLRPVDNSSRPPSSPAGCQQAQPHAGPPSLSSCAATATQPIQPICTNSARWSRLSAYHTVVVASSPRSPKAIDMLPSLSWLDRAQRLVVMMHCPMWDFLRTFFFL